VEDGYVAYDPASDRLHHLNPVAALLSELCDGTRTVAQVIDLVAPVLPEQGSAEIERWIAEAAKAGLLNPDGESQTQLREMNPDELAALAARLRDHGKIQPAFLCQRRAAERAVSDAEKWFELGELAHILGRRDDARIAYGKYLELEPDDAEVRHILVALQDGPAPSRVPDDCIQQLYSRFSSFYEKNMCEELGYGAPEYLHGLVEAMIGDRGGLDVLDLGCGSGLAGVCFKPSATVLTGVDLSPEMVELARARNLYDRLEVAEITDWLDRAQQQFDLIVSCDCFIYFGDLGQIVVPVSKLLRPGGVFAFTAEKSGRYPFALTDSGRYQHHPDHVCEVAASAGLRIERLEESFLRMEYGDEVTGLFAVLQKSDA
jgi:predicted TPR repeat methyltransferase